MTIGENIKKYRGTMKQEELAEKIGISPITLSRWENNQGVPNGEKIQKIANILGINSSELLVQSSPQIKELNERSLHEDHGMMRYKFNEKEVLELPATPEFMPMFERIIAQRLKNK